MLTGEQFDWTRRLALTLAGIERMAILLTPVENKIVSMCLMSANGVIRSRAFNPLLKVPSL
jgi:hypothetical protein